MSSWCTNDEDDEGYVQGMSDLCAPIYVVMSADEEMTFWCFVEVMNRMVCSTRHIIVITFLIFHRSKTFFETRVE